MPNLDIVATVDLGMEPILLLDMHQVLNLDMLAVVLGKLLVILTLVDKLEVEQHLVVSSFLERCLVVGHRTDLGRIHLVTGCLILDIMVMIENLEEELLTVRLLVLRIMEGLEMLNLVEVLPMAARLLHRSTMVELQT